jgi:hypothetical protein
LISASQRTAAQLHEIMITNNEVILIFTDRNKIFNRFQFLIRKKFLLIESKV